MHKNTKSFQTICYTDRVSRPHKKLNLINQVSFPKAPQKHCFSQSRPLQISHEKETYNNKLTLHAGMMSKPLIPYDPDCHRSRLLISNTIASCHRKSSIKLGNSEKTIFKTIYQSSTSQTVKTSKNPGIFAERTRWLKSHIIA